MLWRDIIQAARHTAKAVLPILSPSSVPSTGRLSKHLEQAPPSFFSTWIRVQPPGMQREA